MVIFGKAFECVGSKRQGLPHPRGQEATRGDNPSPRVQGKARTNTISRPDTPSTSFRQLFRVLGFQIAGHFSTRDLVESTSFVPSRVPNWLPGGGGGCCLVPNKCKNGSNLTQHLREVIDIARNSDALHPLPERTRAASQCGKSFERFLVHPNKE